MNFTDQAIVVVLGSTGAGKSKLAIEIAEEFNGEIISSDSMQVILLVYSFTHMMHSFIEAFFHFLVL